MEQQMQLFQSDEFGSLEVLMIGEKPYFPATECAAILGYTKPHDAISRHCRASVKRGVIDRLGRTQEVNYIPEGDLYRLIVRSKLPSAERFERFVFDEVLPSIRKHGAYMTNETLEKIVQNPEFGIQLLRALQEEREKTALLQSRITEIEPKAKYCEMILKSKNVMQVSLIAKDYGMSATAFNNLLHRLKIQYKVGKTWVLYQEYADKGYAKSSTYTKYKDKTVSVIHTYWTQKGRLFLYNILKENGVLPLIEKSGNTK